MTNIPVFFHGFKIDKELIDRNPNKPLTYDRMIKHLLMVRKKIDQQIDILEIQHVLDADYHLDDYSFYFVHKNSKIISQNPGEPFSLSLIQWTNEFTPSIIKKINKLNITTDTKPQIFMDTHDMDRSPVRYGEKD